MPAGQPLEYLRSSFCAGPLSRGKLDDIKTQGAENIPILRALQNQPHPRGGPVTGVDLDIYTARSRKHARDRLRVIPRTKSPGAPASLRIQ